MNDLKLIKKHYGEGMMHLCRELFPTLLETEGLLFNLLDTNFNRTRLLYKDLINNNLIDGFKDYIYSLANIDTVRYVSDKDVYTLMKEASYTLYECKTDDEIQQFKKYYKIGEELCTFHLNRLKSNYVFFAIKDNAKELNRKLFLNPERQDEYGTSVISIQFTRGSINTLSIKNRYNHTVDFCDSTFSNNLENIIPGLTNAFEKEFNLNINQNDCLGFELKGYKKANDKKYYKYNYEINGIYYCPNNIIINSEGEIENKYLEKEKYLVIDYFIIDLVNKKIELFDESINDSFIDDFKYIKNIKILNKENNTKDIIIKNNNNEEIIITINKENKIIKYINNNITNIDDNYLSNIESLEKIEINNVTNIGNNFLRKNTKLKEIYLPKVTEIKDNILENSSILNKLHMPSVESIGDNFLSKNKELETLILDKVKTVGNNFLLFNEKINKFSMNLLEKTGNSFMCSNLRLNELTLINLKETGRNFFKNNEIIKKINAPNIEKVANDFMTHNKGLESIFFPKLKFVGDSFIFYNEKIKKVNLNSLEIINNGFLYSNECLEYLSLPKVTQIGNNFMVYNEILKIIKADNIEFIGNSYLKNNKCIEMIYHPKLEEVGDMFMMENDVIYYIYVPNLIYTGKRCLEKRSKLLAHSTPNLKSTNDYNLSRIKVLRK